MKEKSEAKLIDDTHCEEIMANTRTKTCATTKSDEREEIIRERQDKSEEGKVDQQRNSGCFSLIGEKIRGEELIKSEREGFGVE